MTEKKRNSTKIQIWQEISETGRTYEQVRDEKLRERFGGKIPEVILELIAQVDATEGGSAGWARKHGFNRSVVNEIMWGTIPVTKRIARHLGFEAVVEHRRVG